MENFSSVSRKKWQFEFDILNGGGYDQLLFCVSPWGGIKGHAWSAVKILRGLILETNFRKGQSILGYASTVYS